MQEPENKEDEMQVPPELEKMIVEQDNTEAEVKLLGRRCPECEVRHRAEVPCFKRPVRK